MLMANQSKGNFAPFPDAFWTLYYSYARDRISSRWVFRNIFNYSVHEWTDETKHDKQTMRDRVRIEKIYAHLKIILAVPFSGLFKLSIPVLKNGVSRSLLLKSIVQLRPSSYRFSSIWSSMRVRLTLTMETVGLRREPTQRRSQT